VIRTSVSVLASLLLLGCNQLVDTKVRDLAIQADASHMVPVPFLGLWLADASQCGAKNWQEGYLIGTRQIRLAPVADPLIVAKIQRTNSEDIIVSVTDTHQDWTYDGKFRFILSKSGTELTNMYDSRTASFVYSKCKTKATNAPNK
jgi:hypothetical protein